MKGPSPSAPGARCPQCGDSILAPRKPPPVAKCRSCRTLSLVRDGEAREARTFSRGPLAALVAFLCPLCGGPLPEDVVKELERTRCAYCGHPASLPPSVREVLRLVTTHARVAPPVYRGLLAAWLAVVTLFLVAVLVESFNTPRDVRFETTLSLAPGGKARTADIRVRRRATTFPYLQVSLPELSDGVMAVLRVSLVEVATGRTRSQRLTFGEGRRYGEMSFSTSTGSLVRLPAGEYRIVLDGLEAPAPVSVNVRFTTWESPPLGLLILLANVLLWLLVLDIRWGYGEFVETPLRNRVVRGLALAFAALAIAVVAFDLDPFSPKGLLEETTARLEGASRAGEA